MKITAKFRASRRLRFGDTKTIMSPEMCPKTFGTFEKKAPGRPDRPVRKCDASVLIKWKQFLAKFEDEKFGREQFTYLI